MDSATALPVALVSPAHFLILVGILLIMMLLGGLLRRPNETSTGFLLGNRRLPMWAACLSFVATEVSAVTVISVPATAYNENWEYLQFFIGSAVARVTIAFLFIPAFYRFQCTTIYQFLGQRFGPRTQTCASLFFFVTRLLGSGVRLMAACLALSILLGAPIGLVIIVFIAVGIVYMGLGGMRAVVWTNVLQALVFIGGGVATLVFLGHATTGGWPALWETARAAGKTALWDWGPTWGENGFFKSFFQNPNIIWVAILNGFFGSLAAFGTDQDLMQRLLTLETRRESQRAMLGTIAVSLSVLLIYLSIGTGLFGFYQQPGVGPLPPKPDGVFPYFIGHQMPFLLKGWLLAAIVLAGIDSPLASLATSFVTDIHKPLFRHGRVWSDGEDIRLTRWAIALFGVLLAALAYGFSYFENILWLAFKIGGVTFGSLLGVFLLGLIGRSGSDRTNGVAMVASAVLNGVLLFLSEKKILPMGWSWLVIFGTFTTILFARVLAPKEKST